MTARAPFLPCALDKLPDLALHRVGELASAKERACLRCVSRSCRDVLRDLPMRPDEVHALLQRLTPSRLHALLCQASFREALRGAVDELTHLSDETETNRRWCISVGDIWYTLTYNTLQLCSGCHLMFQKHCQRRGDGDCSSIEMQNVFNGTVCLGSIIIRIGSTYREVMCRTPRNGTEDHRISCNNVNCERDERDVELAKTLYHDRDSGVSYLWPCDDT